MNKKLIMKRALDIPPAQSIPISNPQGVFCYNVQDYGAKGDSSQDDGPAIQACIDALHVAQGNAMGTIFLPQGKGSYLVSNPIFLDWSNQQMVGGGAGATIQSLSGSPAIYLGVKRDKPTNTASFPDAFGVLDLPTVQGPSKQYGQRLGGDTVIQFQSNGFQYGMTTWGQPYDYWEKTQQLTIEFCIDFPKGMSAGLSLFGLGDWQTASPWYLGTSGDLATDFSFYFRTGTESGNRRIQFSTAGIASPMRIALQLDLVAGKCSVLINDKSVAVNGPPIQPGLHLATNDSVPFFIGGGTSDFTLYGLRLSNTIRYVDPGVGKSLSVKPLDGARYFKGDANTIAYLSLDTRDYMNQQVTLWNQPGIYASGMRMKQGDRAWIGNVALKNIIVYGNGITGQTISVGNIFSVYLENIKALGCTALGSFISSCTYPITLKDCTFGGSDCCIFGFFWILKATNLNFQYAGRDVIRMMSCDTNWDTVFIGSPATDTVIKLLGGGYGAGNRFTNVIIDYEGYEVNKAIIYAENNCYVPGTTLALTDFFIGTVGAKAACIMLRDVGPFGIWKKAWVTAENINTWGDYRTFLDTDGPLWSGVINGYFLNPKNLHTHTPTWGPNSPVTFTNVTP